MQWTGPIPWMIVVGGFVFFAVLLVVGLRVKQRVKGTKSPLIYMALGLINFGLLGVIAALGAGAKVWFEQYKVAIDVRGKSDAEILELLDSGDYNVRYNAVQRIRPGRFAAAEAVPVLEPLLEDGAMRVRMAALYALHRYGAEARPAWPAMAQRLADHNARVRNAAHSVLRNSGPEVVEAVWPLVQHEDRVVRDAAVATIVKLKPLPVDALVKMLDAFDGDAYRSALKRLVKHAESAPDDSPKIIEAVERQLEHPKPEMRWAACWGLQKLDPAARERFPSLESAFAGCVDTCILQLAKGPRTFRQRAAWLLARYPEHAERSVPALIAALQDPPAQKAAAEALGDLGPAAEPAIPALISGLRDPGLRKFARAALEQLGDPAVAACRAALAEADAGEPERYRTALTAIVAGAGDQ